MKDNEIALMVNDLTKIAKQYHNHQCLREKISKLVTEELKENHLYEKAPWWANPDLPKPVIT